MISRAPPGSKSGRWHSTVLTVRWTQVVTEVSGSSIAENVFTISSRTSARRGRTWCRRTGPAAAACRLTPCSAVDISTIHSRTCASTPRTSSVTCRPNFQRHALISLSIVIVEWESLDWRCSQARKLLTITATHKYCCVLRRFSVVATGLR